MSAQRGQRVGVSGMLTLASGQQLGGDAYFWKISTEIAVRDRAGPGGTRFAMFRRMNVGSHFSFRMNGTGSATPFPVGQQNCKGTLTLTYHTDTESSVNQYITVVGELVKSSIEYGSPKGVKNEVPSEAWDCGGVLRLTAEPTFSGWTGQITPADQTYLDQEIDVEGVARADSYNLTNNGLRSWDVAMSGDTAGEVVTKATHFLTSAGPFGTKPFNISFNRTDRDGGTFRVAYAMRDPQDNLTFPQTMSLRTAVNGYSDSIGSLVVASGTVAAQANGLYVPFTSESFMWALALHPQTDGKRLLVKSYRNIGIEERISAWGDRYISARVNSGNVQVYVLHNDPVWSGGRRIQFSKIRVESRKVRTFVIRRNLNSPTVPEDSGSSINGVALPDIGKTNGATFQGIPAGQCIYDGPDMTVHLGMPGITSFPMEAGWKFRSDSYGFFDGIPDRMFSQRWEILTNYTGTGWTNVSTLGAPFTDIVQPSTASFAAFVS